MPGRKRRAVAAARGVTSGPVLLVVDYAETRTDLEVMLRAVLADIGPIRVLLVARSLGEWWEQLIEKSVPAIGQLLTRAEPIRLAEQITKKTSEADLIADAIPQFARALQCDAPEQVEFELPVHRVPVLVLHTAALVAALRFRDDPAASLRVVVAEGVLDELLEHEARYWRRKAAVAGLPENGALLKPVVAVAALLGAKDLAEAAEMVVRVPDLSDTSRERRGSWARWLYDLYPADGEGRLGSLQPELLAEITLHSPARRRSRSRACMPTGLDERTGRTCLDHARPGAGSSRCRQASHRPSPPRRPFPSCTPAAQVALQTRSDLSTLLASALEKHLLHWTSHPHSECVFHTPV